MAVLGIDPGLTGGLAIVGKDVLIYEAMMTLDKGLHLPALTRWLTAHRSEIGIAYLERAQAFPGMGGSGAFNYGAGWGAIQGLLAALGIPYVLVSPAKWTKEMHAGIGGDNPKARSAIAAARLFPKEDLRASPQCKKPHDGIIDALLIAEYGYRLSRA